MQKIEELDFQELLAIIEVFKTWFFYLDLLQI